MAFSILDKLLTRNLASLGFLAPPVLAGTVAGIAFPAGANISKKGFYAPDASFDTTAGILDAIAPGRATISFKVHVDAGATLNVQPFGVLSDGTVMTLGASNSFTNTFATAGDYLYFLEMYAGSGASQGGTRIRFVNIATGVASTISTVSMPLLDFHDFFFVLQNATVATNITVNAIDARFMK